MLGAEIENLQSFDWRFPVGRFRSKRRRSTGTARDAMPYLQSYQTWRAPGNRKAQFFVLHLFGCSIVDVLVPLTVETTVGGHPVIVHQPRGSVKDETPLLKAQGGLTAGRSVAK